MFRVFRNFVVANVFAMFPLLWALLGWMPEQVKVRMRGWEEAPGSIMANGAALAGEEYGEWSGGCVFRFYLRAGMEWKDLVFRFPGATGLEAVERIELQKWKLLSLCKRGNGLEERDPGTAEYVFANPRFDSVGLAGGKAAWALAALEVLLAVLSWQCARHHREEAWEKLLPQAIAVVLALTLLTQVALPIQSFWANRASYPFPFAALAGTVAWRFAWMSALGIAAATLLARCFGRRVFGVALALAVCIYLESGILSNGLAHLNGDIFLLQDRMRSLWDAAVWVTVFVVVLAAHPLLRNHYALASLCLAVMVGASLFDTKHDQLADKSNLIVHDFVPIDTVIRSVTYSTNRNVMVFILDSLEREQAHAIMEDPEVGPKLREQFRGFTEFTNNVGALPQTLVAVPNLLTGHYPDGTDNMADYSWSCYGAESALHDFLETGHDVFMVTPGLGCGFSTRTQGDTTDIPNSSFSVLDCSGIGGNTWSIHNFTRWRCMPFATKALIAALTGIANNTEELREWRVYPKLAKAEIEPDSYGVFLFVHTEGVHVPTHWNRHGEMSPAGEDSEKGCVEQGVFILGQLGQLMTVFREKGIYDQSLILMLGDHGRHREPSLIAGNMEDSLPFNARPCLWIKPEGSSHEFASSPLPSSHASISDLLRMAARENLSDAKIREILPVEKRIYRRMTRFVNGWTDWIVAQDGGFETEGHYVPIENMSNVRALKCGKQYSLIWSQLPHLDADFVFQGMWLDFYPYIPRNTRNAAIEFRVPDGKRRYALTLELYDAKGGSLRCRNDAPAAEWKAFPVQPRGTITVHGIEATPSGMARVVFERVSGPDMDVTFTSLKLVEDP